MTIPGKIASMMGWRVGPPLSVKADGDTVCMTLIKRRARGCRSVSEILDGIDENEIADWCTELH